jgi:hypothetical protein
LYSEQRADDKRKNAMYEEADLPDDDDYESIYGHQAMQARRLAKLDALLQHQVEAIPKLDALLQRQVEAIPKLDALRQHLDETGQDMARLREQVEARAAPQDRDPSASLFRFQRGQAVRWAGNSTARYIIVQQRWTQRAGLQPVVEYLVQTTPPPMPGFGWVFEGDLTAWQEHQPPESGTGSVPRS